jgi:acetyltransferase-like isoleucine patch superfamily enzyme
MFSISLIKHYLKHHSNPQIRRIGKILRNTHFFSMPAPALIFQPLILLHRSIVNIFRTTLIWCYWTPLAKQVFVKQPKRFNYNYFGLPFISGNVVINIGENCTLLKIDFAGRTSTKLTPEINIGNNVILSYNVIILSGTKITIEDNVMLSGDVRLNGYSGHPLNAKNRLKGEADTQNQIKPILIKKNAWLGNRVTVMNGVTIGENTVVATGSVVTKNLPDNVLAAGVPAQVIKNLSTC